MQEIHLTIINKYFSACYAFDLWNRAENKYDNLIKDIKNESYMRQYNLKTFILPYVAIYQSLLEMHYDQNTSLKLIDQMMQDFSNKKILLRYQKLAKLPGFFGLFKTIFKNNFKTDVWDSEINEDSEDHFVYTINKCLWHEYLSRIGSPELCKLFCANDDITYNNISKDLSFSRSHALGIDNHACDCHFVYHKKK